MEKSMVRKRVLIRKKDKKIIDAGFLESPKNPDDPEVTEEFDIAKRSAGSGSSLLQQKLREHNSRTPELTANDIDAKWENSDAGDETVGGDNMTPDQSVVDDIGEAVGMTHDDMEPLRASVEKVSRRRNGTRSERDFKSRRDVEEGRRDKLDESVRNRP